VSKKDKEEFSIDTVASLKQVADTLEGLVDGFKNQRVFLSSGPSSIVLVPSEVLKMEIKAKKKGGESKIEIELKWKALPADPKGLVVASSL
jgi:amphi-Trp domain-containing protein